MEFIKNSDSSCVIGCTMKSGDKRVPPLLFTAQNNLLDKCPMILVRLKNLTVNKAAFLTVKPGAS
jgi:hypothetical protein